MSYNILCRKSQKMTEGLEEGARDSGQASGFRLRVFVMPSAEYRMQTAECRMPER
jgi:hypothetical protein